MNNHRRRGVLFLLLAGLLTAAFLLSLALGSVSLSLEEVLCALLGRGGDSVSGAIVRDIRLPRALAAALLGGALAVSGFLLQTYFSNPIASPFVLGISSGAKLMTALFLIGFLGRGMAMNSWMMIGAAFFGSMVSMCFVLLVAGRVGNRSMLVVSGVMIGYICSAVTDFAVTFAEDSNIVNLHSWSLGSFSGISWENVKVMTAVTLPALFLAMLLSKPIGACRMGETYARNMGVDVERLRLYLILLSSVLSASVAAFAGPVSFVGIAVPHLVKSLFRTAEPLFVIPACFLSGGAFCLVCDLTARLLFAPVELSISSVTALFGAPVVIYMLVRRQGEA